MSEQTIKETMQQALDVLLSFRHTAYGAGKSSNYLAVKNLREAIKDCEQAEAQEPVGEVVEHETSSGDSVCFGEIDAQLVHIGDKLYTHPKPQHNKLTDSGILKIAEQQATQYYEFEQEPFIFDGMDIAVFARAIEAKVLGEDV